MPEGITTLLTASLNHISELAQTAVGWIQSLNTAMVQAAEAADNTAPLRRLGRPRKPKPPAVDPA